MNRQLMNGEWSLEAAAFDPRFLQAPLDLNQVMMDPKMVQYNLMMDVPMFNPEWHVPFNTCLYEGLPMMYSPVFEPGFDPAFKPMFDPTFDPTFDPSFKPSFEGMCEPAFVPSDDITQMTFDANNEEKPPYSYSQLITRAILETPNKQMLLSEIYDWMMERFPYFRYDRAGVWKNSVRHNLSVNKAFTRSPRHQTQPGKGSYWTLDQRYLKRFDKRTQRQKTKSK
ncbi:hypothetical protein DSO57_1020485 [Entomophthora muscae]|uniref:Uncharacterized protein n=2 Tax=Entomophthora muscae TaxID=34485 RepID=A0ACC2SQ90_9FUNG|nr:hypothetical protein DSO57_1029883 [Entomophthora muscae]KAJ9088701.1 hypothetical protein DSO57_1020485 [Entomophthora muscae]